MDSPPPWGYLHPLPASSRVTQPLPLSSEAVQIGRTVRGEGSIALNFPEVSAKHCLISKLVTEQARADMRACACAAAEYLRSSGLDRGDGDGLIDERHLRWRPAREADARAA